VVQGLCGSRPTIALRAPDSERAASIPLPAVPQLALVLVGRGAHRLLVEIDPHLVAQGLDRLLGGHGPSPALAQFRPLADAHLGMVAYLAARVLAALGSGYRLLGIVTTNEALSALLGPAGCLIALISFGVRAGFGLFLAPMSDAMGWGREVFALAIAIQNLVWGLGQPLAGGLADCYGPARVLIAGGIAYALGVWLMSVSATPLMINLSAGLLVGIGLAGASFAVVLAAIGRSVPEEQRSWAFGLGTAAGSLGQFLLVPLGQGFIAAYGWQTALTLMSLVALLMVPLSAPLAGKPAASQGPQQSLSEALREAAAHRGYKLLVTGFFVCGFHVAFIQTHLPAYIVDMGVPAAIGAAALALVGLFNIVGSYTAGVLGGRHSKKDLLAGLYFTRSIVIALFVTIPMTTTTVLVFSAAMGLLWLSTVPLTSGLVAQIFGPRYMATLFGIVFLSHQVGSFLGVWLGGYLYDLYGSYDVIWWLSIALGLVAALLHWPIDEREVPRLRVQT
jgi:MFS family permease